MFVILTSKPGKFRTELGDGLELLERYDFHLCGQKRAEFVIARLDAEVRIRIVDESDDALVNIVPSKFFPRFQSLEKAREELMRLASANAKLVSVNT